MVFCIAGTEEETREDGAGEVSTGVESESVVRWRRAVITRSLVPLAGGPSSRVGIDSYWRRRSMRVNFVSNEYYSSIGPHLLHVCDSYSPVLDQYSGDPTLRLP